MLISEALQGTFVRSSQGEGFVRYAEKRNDILGLAPLVFAYTVTVSQEFNTKPDFYTTIYVGVDE